MTFTAETGALALSPTQRLALDARIAAARENGNPYLAEYLEAEAFIEPCDPDDALRMLDTRDELVRRYAWAVPNTAAIAAVAQLGPIIEIGAGSGYWAKLIDAAGGDIVAYDAAPPGVGENGYIGSEKWFDVRVGGPDAIAEHSDRVLLLCWPPYNRPFAQQCLDVYTGDTVAYVGEGWHGCTADDTFHASLSDGWSRVSRVEIPVWPQRSDSLTIWTR